MTGKPVTWVVCGGASATEAPRDAFHIDLGGKKCSLSLNIGGLSEALPTRMSAAFTDLIRIAAFVLGADGGVKRGPIDDDTNDKWHRRFRFVVPVTDPDFWNSSEVTLAIQQCLNFLSQDTFEFEFQAMPSSLPALRQLTFADASNAPVAYWDRVDEIAMFSGGLDSFAGAADLVLAQRRDVLLVSHRSATKVVHAQRVLVDGLSALARDAGAPVPRLAHLDLHRRDRRLDVERTQRTRSFLYAAMAGAVANAHGHSRVLMYENGIIGINLPLAGSVVGARATRTAHPRALSGFSRILSLVAGRSLRVHNPFALKTRTEVIEDLARSPALPLAKETLSCAHAALGSAESPQCGVCSQCIDRQFSFTAAAMEAHDNAHGYELVLATGAWKKDEDRRLLLDYVRLADDFADCPDIHGMIAGFGEVPRALPGLSAMLELTTDEAADAVFKLHKRHGLAVRRALEILYAKNATLIRKGSLPVDSLLMLLNREGMAKQQLVAPPAASTAENQFLRRHGGWHVRFRGGPTVELFEPAGLRWINYLLNRPGTVFTASALRSLSQGGPPSPVALTAPERAAIQRLRENLRIERADALEFTDDRVAAGLAAEIQELDGLLTLDDADPGEPDHAPAMAGQLRAAVAKLGAHSPPLRQHLEEHLLAGPLFVYRGATTEWHTDEPPPVVQAPTGTPPVRRATQLFGWSEILPALGRDPTSRPDRRLIIKLNAETGGPIRPQGKRKVIANRDDLLRWWASAHERAAAAVSRASSAAKAEAATRKLLSEPGERRDRGFHDKQRPNTRKRPR